MLCFVLISLLYCCASSLDNEKYFITNGICPFTTLGLALQNDKVGPIAGTTNGHHYGQMYCEILTPMRQLTRKVRILEIGFGCAHWNKGVGARLLKASLLMTEVKTFLCLRLIMAVIMKVIWKSRAASRSSTKSTQALQTRSSSGTSRTPRFLQKLSQTLVAH